MVGKPLGVRPMTATERSAKRRAKEAAAKEALRAVLKARTLAEARRIAVAALEGEVK